MLLLSSWGTRLRSWLRNYATSRKVAGASPGEVDFFNLPNPSSRTMALGSTNEYQESSWGVKVRPARTTDNLTAICEPTVLKMWEPRRLTTLGASTACYKDSFTFLPFQAHILVWIPNCL
jgi:hypothetical protein